MSINSNAPRKTIVVFSGGSAANNLVDVFGKLADANGSPLNYVIPISDNGGSSSELIRFFGGPGIGDVRSRLVRLIPDDSNDTERTAIKAFFNYRLAETSADARTEWQDIVEARHALWDDISSPKKELIRSYLNLLNAEIVKRARPSSVFNFSSASIGNLFLTAARLFTGSFEAAIYLLSSICDIPASTSVLPIINTNFSHHISAGLTNGMSIPGQNAISHPSRPNAIPESATPADLYSEIYETDKIEDANLPGSLPVLRRPYITFSKAHEEELPARIERIWYINPYGQEIHPSPNTAVLKALKGAKSVIYSIGSLYTSLIPSLVPRNIGATIAALPRTTPRILLLNGSLDRETGPSSSPMTAADFIAAIARACLESSGVFGRTATPDEWRAFVSHVVYLEGTPDAAIPVVDRGLLGSAGIECVRLYGRPMSLPAPSSALASADTNGADDSVHSKQSTVPAPRKGGMRYDEEALTQALMVLVGGGDGRAKGEWKRRYTVEGPVR